MSRTSGERGGSVYSRGDPHPDEEALYGRFRSSGKRRKPRNCLGDLRVLESGL